MPRTARSLLIRRPLWAACPLKPSTDLGLPDRLISDHSGGFTYVDSTTYSSTSQQTQRGYGSGGKIKRAMEWDPATGWLNGVTTQTQANQGGTGPADELERWMGPSFDTTGLMMFQGKNYKGFVRAEIIQADESNLLFRDLDIWGVVPPV